MKWNGTLTKKEVRFFFRMRMMGSAEARSWVDEVRFFTSDKSDLGKVTYAPEVGEYTCVGAGRVNCCVIQFFTCAPEVSKCR